MNKAPDRIAETDTYVHYRGWVDEYPINFRVNKFNRNVEISLSDLLKAAQAKHKNAISELLLINENVMNDFLDLIISTR